MKLNDAVFGALLLLVGIVVLATVQTFPKIHGQNVGPALFPGLISLAMIGCGLLLIVSGWRRRGAAPWFTAPDWVKSPRHAVAFFTTIGAVVAYIVLAGPLGFLVVAPALLFVLFLSYGVRPRVAAIVAVVASLAIWYAFYKLLRVPLPWGLLERFAF